MCLGSDGLTPWKNDFLPPFVLWANGAMVHRGLDIRAKMPGQPASSLYMVDLYVQSWAPNGAGRGQDRDGS